MFYVVKKCSFNGHNIIKDEKNEKMLLVKYTFFHTSTRNSVHISSIFRPKPLEFSSLKSFKNHFSYDEKCGEIHYTGVKFTIQG